MSKINNSFQDFTKRHRNLNYQSTDQAYDKINNPVTMLDTFLRNSAFSKRTMPKKVNTQDLYQKMRGELKPDYFFMEHYPRFKEDQNCNQQIFGQRETQFKSSVFDDIKKQFNGNSYSFHYDQEKLNYAQDSGLPVLPSEKRKQLILIKKEQEAFKSLREEVNFLNKKNRILENLHKSEIDENNEKQIKQRNHSYDKYKNQNAHYEFSNENKYIGDQMNATFNISFDWKSKGKSETQRQNTFERIIKQVTTQQRDNSERKNYLKYQDTRGRDYKIISLTKDEY